ncbi:hypothetical protein OG909_19035 [Streptomyces sp. NBC_01754]|uniref:hypothetical protein n=1 Tax=Streptomyces sp. NBC_01754 TaxID=2975930 RepID=UPI002DDB3965|nr:hypothetical protein [Streptomyces sp. NBC_01754]WSC94192.1 hypothetical protein OG909_19035 [Streptomyces sp. NBC_01754]
MMRRRIRLAAVLVVVVLALTGFQTSSHGGGSGRSGKSGGSGGGGCSSSKKSNGGSYRGGTSSNSSGGSSNSTATPGATAPDVSVVSCAEPGQGGRKAVTSSEVRIRSNSADAHTYEVDVTFVGADGTTVDRGQATVRLGSRQARTVTVRMDSPGEVSRVERCLVSAKLRH